MFEIIARKIAAIACSRPKIVLFVALLLTLISSLYTVKYLTFNPDRNSLISKEKEYNKRFLKLMDEFGQVDNHIIVMESDNTDALINAAEQIAKRLKNSPRLIKNIFYKVNKTDFEKKGLFYLDVEELLKIKTDLLHTMENRAQLPQAYQYEDIFAQFEHSLTQKTHAQTTDDSNITEDIDRLIALLQDMNNNLRENNVMPESPLQTAMQAHGGIPFSPAAMAFGDSPDTAYYNLFDNGRILLMEITVNDIDGLLTGTDSTSLSENKLQQQKKCVPESISALQEPLLWKPTKWKFLRKKCYTFPLPHLWELLYSLSSRSIQS